MKKNTMRLICILLMGILTLGMLSACGEDTEAPSAPTPPAQGESNTPAEPTPPGPPSQTPPSAPGASDGFVKDGKVYITDCVFIGQEGEINGSGWLSWTCKTRQAGEELFAYRSSDEVKASNIEQAMDRAFKPVVTSHGDIKDPYQILNLKNGDVITWTYEIDEAAFDRLKSYVTGIEFVVTDGELVISGLAESMEVNPFENPGFFGIDSYDDANGDTVWVISVTDLRNNSGVDLEVEVDNMGHTGPWNNGDQFKVKILTSPEQLKEYGYVFTQMEGIITIYWK